jgi:protein gp37
MSKTTSIAWCDHTFNLVWGCEKVSPACANCYAKTLADRWGFDVWGANKSRRIFGEKYWREPLKWNAQAEAEGVRRRVFCSSMADVFEDHPTVTRERAKLWPLIRSTPHLDWQLLTKRADRIAECLPKDWGNGYPNVWLGVTAENQEYADRRIPYLLSVPAVVRFISAEPLLGSINLHRIRDPSNMEVTFDALSRKGGIAFKTGIGLDWVIVGGESGAHFRALDVACARSLERQCREANVAFFFKQVGGQRPDSGGDLLGGERYHQMPIAA